MRIYAHRGSSGVEPENTIRAFARALVDGADGIELDVHATADRVPVVIHDRDVARTTDGEGHVDELTLATLRGLDAGKGQPVPTLAEVLALVSDRVHLDIEVKQAGIEKELLAVLAQYPEVRAGISSFDWSILREIRALAPDAEIWPLTALPSDDAFAEAHALGAPAIAVYAKAVDEDAARRMRDAGLAWVVWTVNDVEEAHAARRLGAVGLCTDVPAVIRDGLAESDGEDRWRT